MGNKADVSHQCYRRKTMKVVRKAERWKHHFQTILNCPEPDKIHDFSNAQMEELTIKVGEITAD